MKKHGHLDEPIVNDPHEIEGKRAVTRLVPHQVSYSAKCEVYYHRNDLDAAPRRFQVLELVSYLLTEKKYINFIFLTA